MRALLKGFLRLSADVPLTPKRRSNFGSVRFSSFFCQDFLNFLQREWEREIDDLLLIFRTGTTAIFGNFLVNSPNIPREILTPQCYWYPFESFNVHPASQGSFPSSNEAFCCATLTMRIFAHRKIRHQLKTQNTQFAFCENTLPFLKFESL